MQNNLIIPTILATTEEEYQKKVNLINQSEDLKNGWVQIDIMDNKFVQNKSVGIDIIKKYPINLKVEAHLMVNYPENWIDGLFEIGVDRIIFPVEDSEGIKERITHIKNHGIEVGLALNPETPVEKVMPYIDSIDTLLILSVHPGFGGQEFIPETINKIKQVVLQKNQSSFKIEVDGGITVDNIKDIVEAGADGIVIGERLIYGDIRKNLEEINQKLNR
ncbi:MAG: ribulose-phosphate 3-epimerase [Candidatus Daviesbacteria bacterium]|nr:ribulose-phosphate 3-epimerase [Candidatus Daviesbacteria bacterium]